MSVQKIIESLDNLTRIHHQLIALSEEKTKVVKVGNVEHLQAILVKERKIVQQLDRAEESRHKEVIEWFSQKGLSTEASITNLLEQLDSEAEQKELEGSAVRLTEAIVKLKQQEELNLALIQQSMQFVQLSIDLLSPSLKNLNYGKDNQQTGLNRSLFDSKA